MPVLKKNKTQFALLGMLSIEPMSGYEIRQVIRQSTANFWSESDGQIYPALNELSSQNAVTCNIDYSNGREKKIYRITSKGRDLLKNWLKQESVISITRSEFMLKLFFGANVSPEISLEHVQAFSYQTKAMISQLTSTKQQLLQDYKESPHLPYWLMTIQYGIQISKAKLNWCKQINKTLKKIHRSEK